MPELPEVEVLARHLRPLIRGKTIRGVNVRRAKVLAPSTAYEASGVYVGRPKNCYDESEGLLQGGNCTRTAAVRKFPAISHTLVRPPNPEPYQGSPDAAASGFQRGEKERPMHQDHLLVEDFCAKS